MNVCENCHSKDSEAVGCDKLFHWHLLKFAECEICGKECLIAICDKYKKDGADGSM